MIRYIFYPFNALPRVTNGLVYALLHYNRQFLQFSAHYHVQCIITGITVYVSIHVERNKRILLPLSTGYYASPSFL